MAYFESPTSRFIGAQASLDGARVALFGAGYDGTASFRPGTRSGPAAIRAASDGLETYCPVLDADLEDRAYADVGDADVRFGAPGPQIEAVRAAAADNWVAVTPCSSSFCSTQVCTKAIAGPCACSLA